MKTKVILFTIALTVVVMGSLMAYVFVISPPIKEKYIAEWLRIESSKEPVYADSNLCKDCHPKVYREWKSQSHSTVSCEDCHGPLYLHVNKPELQKPVIDSSRNACIICHKDIPPRKAIRTINPETHAPNFKCIVCHNPHKPWFEVS